MNVAILSRGKKLYSTKRLVEACKKKGHKPTVLDTLQFEIHVEKKNPNLFYNSLPIKNYDAVIPRVGASITSFGTAVVRQFEQMGVFCLNTSQAITVSRDKLRAVQILSRHHIGIPVTEFVKQRDGIMSAIDRVGDPPVIIKLLEGTQGIGVILAESKKMAEAIVETLQSTKQQVLIQKFVKESKGKDIRAFVVGGKVIAAMRRSASGDEFRSNVHRGGSIEPLKLTEEFETTAVHAAQILGLKVAGVDMLESNEGPILMEVNSSPGLEGIERATGIDVAEAIVDYLEEEVMFPEIDIRQRLTLKNGYGVAEIPIGPKSELIGKTIVDSGLRDRDVVILSIIRESITIPNPRKEREILSGDTLVCFGKLETLRTLIPVKRKRKA